MFTLLKRPLLLSTIAVALVAPLPGASPADGLVGHWDFTGCDGKTVADRSPLGNEGVIAAGEIKAEKAGQSLVLNGMDTVVTIREKTPFGFRDQFSASIWVWQANVNRFALLFGRPHANPGWSTPMFGMYQAEKRVFFGTWNPQAAKTLLDGGDEIPLKAWVHLAVTYDGKKLVYYQNGIAKGEKPHTGNIGENGQPFFIGNPPSRTAPPFQGRVGEVRLWKRALQASEIKGLFDSTASRYESAQALSTRRFQDGTIAVSSPGNTPGSNWRDRDTRLLEKLGGFQMAKEAPRLSAFGGWMDRPKEKATGIFRVQKIGERWWLIDPEGCRAIHIGMDQVAPLRSYEKVLAARFGTKERWAEETSRILIENGFSGKNTRNTNEIALMRAVPRPLVYTWLMRFASSFAEKRKMTYATAGHTGFTNDCIPVFHPEFPAHCDEQARALTNFARDPYFLGMFSDNELQCPLDLLDRHLAQDFQDAYQRPGVEAARAWLLARRGTTNLEGVGRRDRLEFIAHVFERYYSVVRAAIRRYDPDHLYIGTRICYSTQFDNPFFMKMCGRYLDVISVNYYGVWGPDLDQVAAWHENSGRPVLFSEWYAKAEDMGLANTHGAGWLVRTQADRAAYYQHTVLGYVESKSCIGWHWFKYQDDAKESTALDAAGGANKGIFDTNYQPYPAMIQRARAVNLQAYALTEFFDGRK